MAARLIVERVVDPGGRPLGKRVSQARLRRSVDRILETNVLCAMATVRGAQAHIKTAYFYYSPDFELFFLSAHSEAACSFSHESCLLDGVNQGWWRAAPLPGRLTRRA